MRGNFACIHHNKVSLHVQMVVWLLRVSGMLLVLYCIIALTSFSTSAQEFRAKISINTEHLQGIERDVFDQLEQKLGELVNNTHWTNYNFSPNERITCEFAINLLQKSDNNDFQGELFFTAQRPVYNASYSTTLVTFRDKGLSFHYEPFDQLVYNPTSFENNLTATIVYYLYFILTLDSDSFSPLGGNVTRNEMMQIVLKANQAFPDDNGWNSNGGNKSRYALAEALNDPAQEPFRQYWYNYHRQGLDQLVGNISRGRTNILEKLNLLEETNSSRPMSPLLNIFAEAKLKELVAVAEKASTTEKKKAFDILTKLFPTERDTLTPLRRGQ